MANGIQLTASDRRILEELTRDGRLSNKELAARVGLPASTCHGRVRALEDAGIIRGYHAEIDPVAAGASVEALILVGVHDAVRDRLPRVTERLRRLPGVQRVFLIGGEQDLVLHVACASVPALRDFIREHLGSDRDLGRTQTQLIFEQHPGAAVIPL
ncbi:Lrp/AsnC family transcriptional regulator [Microbacterium sp. ASV49]|uniref:Lrp/AsnC family transcriptional regulator n=1 Tax=Microbacterium candidum TaxID=3041922 RepID=A0ABT7N3R7_9MICO|nr:Lrp/AsnC family transcriptional regulator [Microbacterium sp. ASV49]MDL9981316.1 Lrp/AsnC family transcriptional regulator [Microbacterium sp. ASV49]